MVTNAPTFRTGTASSSGGGGDNADGRQRQRQQQQQQYRSTSLGHSRTSPSFVGAQLPPPPPPPLSASSVMMMGSTTTTMQGSSSSASPSFHRQIPAQLHQQQPSSSSSTYVHWPPAATAAIAYDRSSAPPLPQATMAFPDSPANASSPYARPPAPAWPPVPNSSSSSSFPSSAPPWVGEFSVPPLPPPPPPLPPHFPPFSSSTNPANTSGAPSDGSVQRVVPTPTSLTARVQGPAGPSRLGELDDADGGGGGGRGEGDGFQRTRSATASGPPSQGTSHTTATATAPLAKQQMQRGRRLQTTTLARDPSMEGASATHSRVGAAASSSASGLPHRIASEIAMATTATGATHDPSFSTPTPTPTIGPYVDAQQQHTSAPSGPTTAYAATMYEPGTTATASSLVPGASGGGPSLSVPAAPPGYPGWSSTAAVAAEGDTSDVPARLGYAADLNRASAYDGGGASTSSPSLVFGGAGAGTVPLPTAPPWSSTAAPNTAPTHVDQSPHIARPSWARQGELDTYAVPPPPPPPPPAIGANPTDASRSFALATASTYPALAPSHTVTSDPPDFPLPTGYGDVPLSTQQQPEPPAAAFPDDLHDPNDPFGHWRQPAYQESMRRRPSKRPRATEYGEQQQAMPSGHFRAKLQAACEELVRLATQYSSSAQVPNITHDPLSVPPLIRERMTELSKLVVLDLNVVARQSGHADFAIPDSVIRSAEGADNPLKLHAHATSARNAYTSTKTNVKPPPTSIMNLQTPEEAARDMQLIRIRRDRLQAKAQAAARGEQLPPSIAGSGEDELDDGEDELATMAPMPNAPMSASMTTMANAGPPPPGGYGYCHSCSQQWSESWHEGPDGPGTLCARCGYHWTRQAAQGAVHVLQDPRRIDVSSGAIVGSVTPVERAVIG